MTETTPEGTTMAEHTPGPWKACGTIYEHMNCEIRSGRKGEGQGIAQVWDGPNAFRDGQLMAAAPELLAALTALESVAKYGGLPIQAELEDARAAIARATGATS